MLLISSLSGGCFSPDLDGVECMVCEGACPEGLTCLDGYCLLPGSSRDCSAAGGTGGSASAGGSQGQVTAGAAGDDAVGGSGGLGGTTGGTAGGVVGSAGEGGAGGDGSPEIQLTLPKVACSGAPATAKLLTETGRAPFTWTVVHGDGELASVPGSGEAMLTGEFPVAGEYEVTVRVTDADERSDERRITLRVKPTPVIEKIELPTICSNELYAAELKAHGGDPSEYEWDVDWSTDLGLELIDGRLEGLFTNSVAGPATVDVTLNLESDGCVAEPVTLPLFVEAAESEACPVIYPASGTLRAPCVGSEYSEAFTAFGGSGLYTWSSIDVPDGLAFEESTSTLSGVATEDGPLRLSVSDATGRKAVGDFSIQRRTRCWFAYLADEAGASRRLHLFDALLENHHAVGTYAADDLVQDFAFSPDGRYLAYRIGPRLPEPLSSGPYRLGLVQLASLSELVLSFDDVRHYEWSSDASTLAVSYSATGVRALGGIRIGSGSSVSTAFTVLEPEPVDVQSDFAWVDVSRIAFLISNGDTDAYATTSELEPDGFSFPVGSWDAYAAETPLKAAAGGFYAIPTDNFLTTFYPPDAVAGVIHDQVRIAPSGRYTARTEGSELALFRAEDMSLTGFPAFSSTAGCDALIAWAELRERLACARDGAVNLFDVDPTTQQVGAAVALAASNGYPDMPGSFQRLFSPTGGLFAFTTADEVYVAGDSNHANVAYHHTFEAPSGQDHAVLAFSPDERLLLEHRGSSLHLIRLGNPSDNQWEVNAGMLLAPACSEELEAPLGTYCGERRHKASFAWSPDSEWFAFSTAQHVLRVADVRAVSQSTFAFHVATNACSESCVALDHFAFQP
jgi:hypothetical protein